MRRRTFLLLAAAAATRPWSARAQQKTLPVVGFLNSNSPKTAAPFLEAFRHGLGETGYVEGQNVAIEYRWAEDRYERLPALAAELIGHKIDLIATNDHASWAAKKASSAIPIVFLTGGDPVEDGLVASLSRPGGNATGISLLAVELNSKRLELLSELVPDARVFGLMVNPKSANTARTKRDVQEAARTLGMQLEIVEAGGKDDFENAFSSLARLHARALVVGNDAVFTGHRDQLIGLAARDAIPAIYARREFAVSGGLIGYGSSITVAYRQMGNYAGKILQGAKPADLPVQQAIKFELALNLATAKALGLTVPPSLLARADEVIE
jgi:putative tryptophan/tyrosine transport system substrate-binding protein